MPDVSGQFPSVSVVTATWNARAALESTLDSVVGQRGPVVQHVVIDGGSDDGSVTLLASRGDSVEWLSEPDKGIYDALNKGVARATGDYILILGAGDIFADQKSLLHLWSLSEPLDQREVLLCDVNIGSGTGATRFTTRRPRTRLRFKQIPHQGAVVPRAVFDTVGPFDTTLEIAGDYDFMVRAAKVAPLRCMPVVLTVMEPDGVSAGRDWTAVSRRLEEERRVHLRHAARTWERVAYQVYWSMYLPFRKAKSVFAR